VTTSRARPWPARTTTTGGPLAGVGVVELAAIGPSPFGCMVLADLGADVVVVDRIPGDPHSAHVTGRSVLQRGRRSICVDLGSERGSALVRGLAASADVFVEGLRPGVAARLGLADADLLERNPRLVYAHMTGWGQQGPQSQAPGHDINYIAVAGALEAIGRSGDAPVPPLNLVGDNGGGGMLLALGIASALVERATSGRGQILDVAMMDGAALLTTNFHGFIASGAWDERRGHNLCTGAHFYDTYETSDGGYLAVGAQEPKFYVAFMTALGFDPAALPDQYDRTTWTDLKSEVARRIGTRSRDEWCAVFDGVEACVSPVLSFTEAPGHPQALARATFVDVDGIVQPAPAPRFGRTPPRTPLAPPGQGAATKEVLGAMGVSSEEIGDLRRHQVVWWPDDDGGGSGGAP